MDHDDPCRPRSATSRRFKDVALDHGPWMFDDSTWFDIGIRFGTAKYLVLTDSLDSLIARFAPKMMRAVVSLYVDSPLCLRRIALLRQLVLANR